MRVFHCVKQKERVADGICSERTFIYIYAALSRVQKGDQKEDFFPLELSLLGVKWDNKKPGFRAADQPVKEKPESAGEPTEAPTR